jgi:outer membrane protein, adhesin transport system
MGRTAPCPPPTDVDPARPALSIDAITLRFYQPDDLPAHSAAFGRSDKRVERLMVKRCSAGVAAACGLAVAVLASSPLPGGRGGAGAASLEDSVQAALATNPEVGVVQADREAVDQEVRQARALYFPSLDLRGAIGPEYTNSPGTRATQPGDDASEGLIRMESQITLTQELFSGFARRAELDRQTARLDSAARRVREAAEFIGLNAVEAHLDVLRNQVLVDLAAENLEAHGRILGQVGQLEREGAGTLADVRQTEARVAAAENAFATATGNLRDARAAYIAVVGDAPEALESPLVPVAAVPESGEAAAARASVASPTVQITRSDIDVSVAELTGARAGYYPRLDLELGAAANENVDGIQGGEVNAQALLVLRYNLFRGGGDIAREREAFFRVKEQREILRRAQRVAEEDARVSYNALLTARERVQALRGAADAQRATRDIYAQQFDLGQRSLLDLLDSENELFLARSNLVTAEFTEMFAVYRVLAVIGDLLMTLDIDAPSEEINIYRTPRESIHEPPLGPDAREELGALGAPPSMAADETSYEIRPAGFEGFLDGVRASGAAR